MTQKYEYTKSWRKRNPEKFHATKNKLNTTYNKKYPIRRCFGNKIYHLLKQDRIQKTPCVECGSDIQVQACSLSTNVYDPLWLCDACNKALHKRIRVDK